MNSNNQNPNHDQSLSIASHLITFSKNNKLGILIILTLAISYSIYMEYNNKLLYTCTSILDSKELVKRDVMKEIVHDFFKSEENLDIKNHQLRSDTFKLSTRFYLDLYLFSNSTEKIERQLLKYILSDSLIKNSLHNQTNSTAKIIKLLNEQLSNDSIIENNGFIGNKNIKLSLTEKLIEKQQLLVSLQNYTPIKKSLGVPVIIEKASINFIKFFFKCFFSLSIVLIIILNFRNKIS